MGSIQGSREHDEIAGAPVVVAHSRPRGDDVRVGEGRRSVLVVRGDPVVRCEG